MADGGGNNRTKEAETVETCSQVRRLLLDSDFEKKGCLPCQSSEPVLPATFCCPVPVPENGKPLFLTMTAGCDNFAKSPAVKFGLLERLGSEELQKAEWKGFSAQNGPILVLGSCEVDTTPTVCDDDMVGLEDAVDPGVSGTVQDEYFEISLQTFLEEFRWLLLGIEGSLFWMNQDSSSFVVMEGVSVEGMSCGTFQSALKEFLFCGIHRNSVWCCANSFQRSAKHTFQELSSVLRQMVLAHDAAVVDLCSQSELGFIQFLFLVQPYCQLMKVLADFCGSCGSSVIDVLNSLFAICSNCPNISPIHSVSTKLFVAGIRPLLRYMEQWIFDGVLNDSENDFFISFDFAAFNSRDRKFWRSAFALRKENIPSFISEATAVSLFESGKMVNLLDTCGAAPNNPHRSSEKEEQNVSESTNPKDSFSSFPCCALQGEMKPERLKLDLKDSFPIGPQVRRFFDSVANSRKKELGGLVIDFLLNRSGLLNNLELIREFFLCSNGRFSSSFCESLFKILSANSSAHLGSALSLYTLSAAFEENGISPENCGNLELFIGKAPDELDFSSFHILDFIDLRYEVPWPANLILTKECMELYRKIFRMLLSVQWVQVNMKDLFSWLKDHSAQLNPSGDLLRLNACRAEMSHFLLCLQEYLSNQVIISCWADFKKELQRVRTFDELHLAHKEYLTCAINRCLLNPKAEIVNDALCRILDQMLKFRVEVVSLSPYEDFAHVYEIYGAFKNYTKRFVFRILKRLAESGYEPRLHALLLRLNFNKCYDTEI